MAGITMNSSLLRGSLALVAMGLVLSGCGGFRESLGLTKNSPDEFAVVTHKPLVVPPEFGLRPPRPGEKRPEEFESSKQAVAALFPGRELVPGASPGERALLTKIGGADDGADVRSNVGDSNGIVADKGVFLREILSTEDGVVDNSATAIDRVDSEPLAPPQ